MATARFRLSNLLAHFLPSSAAPVAADATPISDHKDHKYNHHTLCGTAFLPRAAEIEPDVG